MRSFSSGSSRPFGRHADGLEAEPVEWEVAADGEQDLVRLDRVALAELDDVRAVGALAGSDARGARREAQGHAVVLEGLAEQPSRARCSLSWTWSRG